ncbi:YadA-like family protein [Veillonella parvula]|uniref:YadA-like family protein n=1 Tax=Veillonella parvula TaxID=29466 RepID=UPI0009BFE9F7|nr:YadA-like family protein [Veillonella parvula]
MNKIFKVVCSKSKNCYVVVSEFAKNNSGKKKIVVAAILVALAMTNASISMAANTLPTNMHATAVGLGAGASVTGDKAVGFGQNAAAAGGYSIAIGSNSSTTVNSPQGIAIGGGNTANEGARVIGEQAIAIGGNTIAQGNSSIVIGGDDVVKADSVKVIYTTNNGENKTGDLRSAVQSLTGFDMRNPLYTSATAGESGITLGMKGQSGNVGIAIGGGSNTDVGGTKQSSYTLPNNVVASWAGGDKTLPGDVVSFGSKGYERQLKHVAPGEVSATSTDAINGSQLSAIVDQIAYKYISIKSSDAANKDNTGATAANSIAIGPNAATDAFASRSVAVGDGARGKVVDGVAVGSKSIADIASGVAGYNVNASRTDISAWKVTAAGGTVEKVQGGDTVKFQAGDNLVVNRDRTTFTYGLAKDLKGLNSVIVGDENGVSTKITPAGTTVKDAAGNSTTINGGGMTITPADTAASPVSLTVDGLNNGGNKIHGVAPGTADTDAVNVSQLKASNAGLQEAVNRVGTETQRVGAHAAAMAALKPIQYDPLEPTQIMAGIGSYRGETAGAIGIAHYRTEDTMFNVGVSLGTSHNMVNAGVTHKFGGSRERKDAIPERYKAGPISSVYVMQDEVSSLKKENSNQKTVIANQAARLNTLEAENERQRQELAETKQGLDDLRAVVNQLLASKG